MICSRFSIGSGRAAFIAAALVLCLAQCARADSQIAFPGAAGWGRFAKGARASSSPTVYHVTNLNDSGTGSLRDAASQGGRIIVFDVSGVINIESRIVFKSNTYIAGQTAPGEGITVYGDGCSFSGASNVICRYLRWRMGRGGSEGKDCAGLANGTNLIFDHCSFSWGRDETFSLNPDGKGDLGYITVQNTIMGQGLAPHSAGGLMQTPYVTLYRNLYCSNKTRNNKIKTINQYANNIVYDWESYAYNMGGDSSGSSYCNIEANLFITGPAGGKNALSGGNSDFHYYGNDNWLDSDKNGRFNPTCIDETMTGDGDKVATKYDYPDLPLYPGNSLIENNLPVVGASLPYRDLADAYMAETVASFGKKGGIITYETSLPIGEPNSWEFWTGTARKDTDGDGIPDSWEDDNDLDKFNADDAVEYSSNGYLNIENYINSISASDSQFHLRTPMLPCVSAKTTTSITAAWYDWTTGEDGFEVEWRKNDASTWTTKIASAGSTSSVLSGLESGAYYQFRIRAYATVNGTKVYSEYSPTVTAFTLTEDIEYVDINNYEPDVTWIKGTSTITEWNKSNTGWQESGKTFKDGDKVLLNNPTTGSANSTITVTESVAPESVVVDAGRGPVTLDGAGFLGGSGTSINKTGANYLYLNGANTYTGPTVCYEGAISFWSLANGGEASSIGSSTSLPDNWVFAGGTYRYSGDSTSTDRNALVNADSTFSISKAATTVAMEGTFEGASSLTISGPGKIHSKNASLFGQTGALILRGNTTLSFDSVDISKAFKPKQLVLGGATVTFKFDSSDQNNSFPLELEDGTTSYMNLPSHGSFSGRITGSTNSILQINVPYCREYFNSNLSAFYGTLVANGTSNDTIVMPKSSWNAPNTRIRLTGKGYLAAWETNGKNYLGGISGSSSSRIYGSSKNTDNFKCSWTVGSANTDETFEGIIENKDASGTTRSGASVSITKVGTGDWKLTGNNTYSGTTTISEGRLLICGTHSGTGAVTVNDGGTLRGTGKIGGAVTVKSGGIVNPGDVNTASSLTTNGSVQFENGSRLKVGNSALYANGAVNISSGATLEIDAAEKTLKAGASIQVFKGAFNISGTFSSIEPASPGEDLEWDTSALYSSGVIKVYSNIPIKTYFIGGNDSYWDQPTSWDNGVPEAGVTAVFTNAATLTVNMPWNNGACVCDAIELNGADVKFHSCINWPRLSPKSVTGTGTMYLQSDINKDNSGNTAVGLVTQDAADMLVEVPVVLECASSTDIEQDNFFEGLNDHVINFFRPVTVLSGARLIAYSGMYLRGGFAVESTKWNSLRGTNTIACNLTGAGNLYLEENAGVTWFTGDNSGFTGTINQKLYSNVPRFIGGASAPVNGTVNIKGDMFIIPSEYGETFRFGALNLTRDTWYFCYVMKNMGVKIEVGSKGDSFWEDGYYFGTWDGANASTTETTDAEIVKVGAGTTLAAYAQQYDNTKISTKDGICIHPRWSQDFENEATYLAQFSGGTVASTAFGTGESSYNLKGTVTQAERTIYGTVTTSKFFRVYTTARNDTNGAVFSMPAKVSEATEGYRVEFDYYLSQNITDVCSGMVIKGVNGVLATIYGGPGYGKSGAPEGESSNGGIFKGNSNSDENKIATLRSWSRGKDPAAEEVSSYWNHFKIIGIPSGDMEGVYLSVTRIKGDATDDNVASYKLSDTYDTIDKLNLISITTKYNWDRYTCLDNVVASIAETGKPYIANDDGATLSGDEDSGWTLTPSAGASDIVVYIPTGVAPASVTVRAPVDSATVTPNGANVRVVRGESDITDYLDIPAAVDGVVSIAGAAVKDEFVKEPLDPEKGAVIELSTESVRLVTAPTRGGLVYQLKEGETLGEMFDCEDGDSKIGDGGAWEPTITVSGGESGFYTISVGK